MIEGFYFSIAGKKSNNVIDQLIEVFLSHDFVPEDEKKVLRYTQKVADKGNYPSESYYRTFYPQGSDIRYNSLAEISTYCSQVLDFYQRSAIERGALKAINSANSTKELKESLLSLCDDVETVSDDNQSFSPVLYSNKAKVTEKGLPSGVTELDEVTHGFQRGTIASICGFVGHGKSTFVESVAFKNALEGNKCIFVSLELPPEMIWSFIEARYMYQVKGIQVTAQELYMDLIAEDVKAQVEANEQDFLEEIGKNLRIIDESVLSKDIVLNYKRLAKLITRVGSEIGGVDMVVFDHVGQFDLLFKDQGNAIIKQIQSFTKTYKDERGNGVVTLFAVQTNRQGMLRAKKRKGVYDLLAIADLNEVEKSSTYAVFLYTDDDMKIMQETKVTLAKHRLGSVIPEAVTTSFNPEIITVGALVESVSMSDDDFNTLDLNIDGDFDTFV